MKYMIIVRTPEGVEDQYVDQTENDIQSLISKGYKILEKEII